MKAVSWIPSLCTCSRTAREGRVASVRASPSGASCSTHLTASRAVKKRVMSRRQMPPLSSTSGTILTPWALPMKIVCHTLLRAASISLCANLTCHSAFGRRKSRARVSHSGAMLSLINLHVGLKLRLVSYTTSPNASSGNSWRCSICIVSWVRSVCLEILCKDDALSHCVR